MKRRGVTTNSEDVEEILDIALKPGAHGAGPPKFQATASRRQLAGFLKSFGEDSVAERVADLSDDEMQRIFTLAATNFLDTRHYARAVCLAAVEVAEGRRRELARKRRKHAT